jgi:hypothetical protein
MPKRAFASRADAHAFLSQALAWWQAAQLPLGERIARYLGIADVACPACRYNLRGCRSATCPECGQPLTLEKLMTARQ